MNEKEVMQLLKQLTDEEYAEFISYLQDKISKKEPLCNPPH